MSPKDQTFTYVNAKEIRKTQKAVLLQLGKNQYWFPKSGVLAGGDGKFYSGRIQIADWLLDAKGITTNALGNIQHKKSPLDRAAEEG